MMLLVWLTFSKGLAADSGSSFHKDLVEQIRTSPAPSVVIFTAAEGRTCRPVLDAMGAALAPHVPLHLVDESEASALDFLRAPEHPRSAFHRFAEANKIDGFVVVHRSSRFDDAVVAKIDRLARGGDDRDGWRAVKISHLIFLVETRPTARFGASELVRDLAARARVKATHDGCNYFVMTAAELTSPKSCTTSLSRPKSGWFKAATVD